MRLGLAIASALVGVLVALLVGPHPPALPDGTTGDPALAGRARAVLGTGHGTVAVALVEDGKVTVAGFGADGSTPFEIGSVTKPLTGMLLADLARTGDVRLDQPVGELVPGTPLAGARATLRDLAQHRSGLPRLEGGLGSLARQALANYTGSDPYDGSAADVLAIAGRAGAPGGAEPAYSNLGASALGDALAAQQRTDYPTLLRDRIVRPLGLTGTTVVSTPAELPAGRPAGADADSGRTREPWVAAGWAPAGIGVWSTADDLGRLATALLAGTAPGAASMDPTRDNGDGERIGLFWVTSEERGRQVTWHNGATGGFRSYLGLDREAGRAVVVLSASSLGVEDAALDLLLGEPA
jgi:CubicO group peptidase (beta-lactamase class C family)